MKLNTKYIDHTTGKHYDIGEDVKHLGKEQRTFLLENGHIEGNENYKKGDDSYNDDPIIVTEGKVKPLPKVKKNDK